MLMDGCTEIYEALLFVHHITSSGFRGARAKNGKAQIDFTSCGSLTSYMIIPHLSLTLLRLPFRSAEGLLLPVQFHPRALGVEANPYASNLTASLSTSQHPSGKHAP